MFDRMHLIKPVPEQASGNLALICRKLIEKSVETHRGGGFRQKKGTGLSPFARRKVWPRQESNLNLELRKLLYYPLYDEAITDGKIAATC